VLALRAQDLDAVDVVWRTPCNGPEQSMPIGNGEVGCNVWCTADGVLHGYVARSDSFSEASRLLKLGAFELPLRRPGPGEFFEQRLRLGDGAVRVTIGEGPARVVATLFVDSGADVVHRRRQRVARSELRLRSWRQTNGSCSGTSSRRLTMKRPAEVGSSSPPTCARRPRCWDPTAAPRCCCATVPELGRFTAARQSLPADAVADLLLSRTFGLVAVGKVPVSAHRRPGPSAAAHRHPAAARLPHRRAVSAGPGRPGCYRRVPGRRPPRSPRAHASPPRTHTCVVAFVLAALGSSSIGATATIPANSQFAGVDSGGGNRLSAAHEVVLFDAATGGRELFRATPAATCRAGRRPAHVRRRGCASATIRQQDAHPIRRIVDKLTAGRSDGFLFDTHPAVRCG
jgi:hypothetical protein